MMSNRIEDQWSAKPCEHTRDFSVSTHMLVYVPLDGDSVRRLLYIQVKCADCGMDFELDPEEKVYVPGLSKCSPDLLNLNPDKLCLRIPYKPSDPR
jgi:hypothetical protein